MTSGQRQFVKVGKACRVTLSPQVRDALGVKEGAQVLFEVENGEVRLLSVRAMAKRIQAKYAGRFPGMLDELIAERRAEAERESAE